jgi:hypothetical protein
MANNILQLKIDLKAAFGANLDTATIQKLRDRFVSAYPSQWQKFLADNALTDTAANRNQFAAETVFSYIQDIYRSESAKANLAALPAADTIA